MTDTADNAPEEQTLDDNAQVVEDSIEKKDFDFVLDKYRSEDRTDEEAAFEQAKAYTELQGKLGAFTGAPEEYELSLSEEMAEHINIEDYADDPILQEAKDLSKDLGINNEAFNKLTEIYFKGQLADIEAAKSIREEEMKALGSNASRRLENIQDWGKANLGIDNAEALNGALTSASVVAAVEELIAKTRNAPQAQDNPSIPSITHEKLKEMQVAKDEHGNPKMNDPEYRNKVRKYYGQLFGEEPHSVTVGR